MRRGCEKKKHSEAGREEVKVERSGMRWRGVVVVLVVLEGGGRALQEDDVMYLG